MRNYTAISNNEGDYDDQEKYTCLIVLKNIL
jgi:hypothetical protein